MSSPPPDDDEMTLDLELLPAIGPEGRGELLIVRAADAEGEVEERVFVPFEGRS